MANSSSPAAGGGGHPPDDAPAAPGDIADFDEHSYLALNPDVAEHVRKGGIESGYRHYVLHGRAEGRLIRPKPAAESDYDEKWYLMLNPDVAAHVRSGAFESGYQHYLLHGKAEGRPGRPPAGVPDDFDEDMYLKLNPDVAKEVQMGAFQSGFQHYILHGRVAGRPTRPPLDIPEDFDEELYLKLNPDIAAKVREDEFESGWRHYVLYGRAAGRPMRPPADIPEDFDEALYLRLNPDVAEQVRRNEFESGYRHYVLHGRAAGRPVRPPSRIPDDFDEELYLKLNPDVAEQVRKNEFESGWRHYVLHGRAAGRSARLPSDMPADFDESAYLDLNPDVAAQVQSNAFESGFRHYVLHGRQSGRAVYHPSEAPEGTAAALPERVNRAPNFQIDFSKSGNSDNFIGLGWSRQEADQRWAVGVESELILPPLDIEEAVLTLECAPYTRKDRSLVQRFALVINRVELDAFELNSWRGKYQFCLPPNLLLRTGPNIIKLLHPDAEAPAATGEADDRALAISVSEISIDSFSPLFQSAPELLPEAAMPTSEPGQMAVRFQSLGQNCEFGLVQRRCDIEPLGLFRFTSIIMPRLLHGIATGFAGIADPEKLRFVTWEKNREFIGLHDIYGLNYHTLKFEGQIDAAELKHAELRRLSYLARALVEQIAGAEKIFVVQRDIPPLALREVLPLLHLLRSYNPNNKLLWVSPAPENETDLVGRVQLLGSGFFHGYVDHLAPKGNIHDISFRCWLEIVSAVYQAT